MKIISLLLITLIFCSCEGIVDGNGKIISSIDKKPIDSVFVYWTNENERAYSDSIGRFEIGSFCGAVPDLPELELIFYKKGYETKYINFTKEYKFATDSLTIEMVPTSNSSDEIKERPFETFLKYFNTLISLFNVFTLIFICRSKLKHKTLWILALIFLSLTVKYNYYSGDITANPLSFFLQYRFLKIYYIGWYLFFIPLTSLVFWTYYFYNKKQKSNSADT
jgi:hypothetical protein